MYVQVDKHLDRKICKHICIERYIKILICRKKDIQKDMYINKQIDGQKDRQIVIQIYGQIGGK